MRFATWKVAAYLSSVLMIGLLVARQLAESQVCNDLYQITEWRIFYPGHLIRRGLRGSLVDGLSRVSSIPPATLIRFTCTLGYAVLTVLFTWYLFRWLWDYARSCIPILLLSPAGLFFYQDAILSIDRFDVFFLLLTVCHLELCVRANEERDYLSASVGIFSTLGVAAVLCHEAFLLLCLPVNVLLSSWRLGRWDGRLVLIYWLPILVGCECLSSHVSDADVETISNTLGVPIGSFEWYNGPIYLLSIPVGHQIEVVRSIFSADAIRPFLITAIGFGLVHFALLRRAVSMSEFLEPVRVWVRPDRLWLDLLWIPFIFTFPLYAVAADYGRWFVMVVATLTICCARLLHVASPVKRASSFWNVIALIVFVFVPMPLSLKFPNSSPELLSWSGAAILGHFFGKPAQSPEFRSDHAPNSRPNS